MNTEGDSNGEANEENHPQLVGVVNDTNYSVVEYTHSGFTLPIGPHP